MGALSWAVLPVGDTGADLKAAALPTEPRQPARHDRFPGVQGVESLQIPWTNDDPTLAILPDPPCLPLQATLLEALALVRGSLDCAVPGVAGQETLPAQVPLMAENTGCVLVVEDGTLRRIVTARDLVRLASGSLDLGSTPLSAVMTPGACWK